MRILIFKKKYKNRFKETFRWRLEGSTELLSLLCMGYVRAPTFDFVPEKLNFGKVSYSFPETKYITINNTSDVEFTYSLKIPGDGKLGSGQREFEIEPMEDTIPKKKSKEIKITFIPKSTKKYDMTLTIDIKGVG